MVNINQILILSIEIEFMSILWEYFLIIVVFVIKMIVIRHMSYHDDNRDIE